MRVILEANDRQKLFKALELSGYSTKKLSDALLFHQRTINDWRRGKFKMPLNAYQRMVALSKLDAKYLDPTLVDERLQKTNAGKIGGKVTWEKLGKIGTIEDKQKGGNASFRLHKNNLASIFARQKITIPDASEDLAEFIGIAMGDGSITKYQLIISLNDVDDLLYISYVAQLSKKLFGLTPTIQKRHGTKCSNIVMSSILLTEFLTSLGLPLGDKIRAGLDIPTWIQTDDSLMKVCIRGLFDTDGSIFLEKHPIKGRVYAYPRLSLVSASPNLRETVCSALCDFGISAKIRSNRSVNIERFTDIENYFKMIGSSNQKHLDRLRNMEGCESG